MTKTTTTGAEHERLHHGHRSFLPGDPVPNDEIEDYIGKAGRSTSDLKDITLANCGIKTRHYAINKAQQTVISNAAMAANAVRNAAERAGLGPDDVELLCAATTLPDLMRLDTPARCTASWATVPSKSRPCTGSAVQG